MTGQCRHDGIYFVFFFPPAKEEGNPTHIAHDLSRFIGIAKATQLVPTLREANATTKALSKGFQYQTQPIASQRKIKMVSHKTY